MPVRQPVRGGNASPRMPHSCHGLRCPPTPNRGSARVERAGHSDPAAAVVAQRSRSTAPVLRAIQPRAVLGHGETHDGWPGESENRDGEYIDAQQPEAVVRTCHARLDAVFRGRSRCRPGGGPTSIALTERRGRPGRPGWWRTRFRMRALAHNASAKGRMLLRTKAPTRSGCEAHTAGPFRIRRRRIPTTAETAYSSCGPSARNMISCTIVRHESHLV